MNCGVIHPWKQKAVLFTPQVRVNNDALDRGNRITRRFQATFEVLERLPRPEPKPF